MADLSATSKLADPTLLEAIDKLFELNIGEHVALPQLLVVGDQSSGKSSVLEGLTGIPYPRASTLCTRFATQITFRRSLVQKTSVSVIPVANAQPDYAEKLRKWKKDDLKDFNSEVFGNILLEVYDLMGLAEAENSAVGEINKTFADDVLRIEICGPEQQHLSVIDVPGIFRKTTAGVTTKADMAMVRNMVSSYMQNPRSAMLAVVPANVDIGTQEILDMAEQCDPKGERTLGVLTKPDLVDEGAELAIMDIIEGRSHALNLGWCIVRNSGQQQLKDSTAERHAREKLFFTSEAPWNKLPKDRVGIPALHTRLVDILSELIRREFPNVRADINMRLKKCKQAIDGLGPDRATKEQQYDYLLELATRFQIITTHALRAYYGADEVFEKSKDLKLATQVVHRNAVFSHDVRRKGHTMEFSQQAGFTEDETNEANGTLDEGSNVSDEYSDVSDEDSDVSDGVENYSNVRYEDHHRELDDLMHDDTRVPEPKESGIKEWLVATYKTSQGFELGTFDPALLPIVWKKQSKNWDTLALAYIDDIVAIVHRFTVTLLSKICRDERIRRGLNSILLEELTERYKKAIDHTNYLLTVERSGTPLTTNHYFADNLEKFRAERLKVHLQKHQYAHYNSMVVDVGTVTADVSNLSNLEHTVCDIHDILKSYYKVARKRFVDNVCMQAADFHLVTGPDTPVRVFSPKFVSKLSTEQLETIAGEDISSKRKRAELEREIKSLEKARGFL